MKTPILIAAIFFTSFAFGQEKKIDSVKTKNIETVTLRKQVFKKQSDRFVYDVASSPVAKGNSTFDLLKQTPLISTTDEKSLKIAGKNSALIYINGRKSNMDSESLAQFLKNTPAENIQKIEVITVPGSEYQVEGSEGIINIVLKKKTSDGINGNFKMSNAQNLYNATSSSLGLNFRKGKLGINGNFSASQYTEAQDFRLKNGNNLATSESSGRFIDPSKDLGGYVNIDYQLNEKNSLALSWNNWTSDSPESTGNFFNTIKSFDATTSTWKSSYNHTLNYGNTKSVNNSFNLNYEVKTDSLGSKLNVNAAYLNYKRSQINNSQTLLSDAGGFYGDLLQDIYQNTPQKIQNFSAMIDYIKKFKNDFTLSIGGNYNNTKTDNNTQSITSYFGSNPSIKSEPNYFIYNENIYGGYLTLEKKFSDKFTGKIGTRYEITNSIGTSDNAPAERPELAKVEQNYNNILPFLSVNYSINDKNNISYSFSSRMRRPSFWELNPVKNILTATNYTQNNPFVKAATSYNQELTYMLKNSYFLILGHSYIKNAITQIPLQRDVVKDGVSYRQLAYIRTNIGDKQEMSAMMGMQKNLFKQYWTTNFNIGVQHNRNNASLNTDPTTGEIFDTYINKKNSTSFVIQSNNTIRLDKAKTWYAGVNFFYTDKQQIELGTLSALASLDLSIKKLWNNWTFSVNASDILRTYVIEIEDKQTDGSFNYVRNDQFRRGVTASVVYNFGNNKVKKVRNIDGASDAIKSRTK